MNNFLQKAAIVCILAVICLAIGLAMNSQRERPLPLVYESKAERIEESLAKLQVSAPTPAHEQGKIREAGLKEFQELLSKGNILLDARPEVFHRLGHIPGAKSLPREDFEEGYSRLRNELESHRNEVVLIYCSREDCEDSRLAANGLLKLGYREMVILEGGWKEWEGNGLPVEKAP